MRSNFRFSAEQVQNLANWRKAARLGFPAWLALAAISFADDAAPPSSPVAQTDGATKSANDDL
jgi:hypothetical protein